MSEITKELLNQYGTKKRDIISNGAKTGEIYAIGCLEVDTNGFVWLDNEVKNQFIGCIETVGCLQEVCEMWNNEELDNYKR